MDKLAHYKFKALVVTYVIIFMGLFLVFDASKTMAKYYYNDEFYYFKRQLIFVVLGSILLFCGKKINLEKLKKYNYIFLIINYILLILVLIPNVGLKRNGSSSWLGFKSFAFQPSEFLKIFMIIYYASFISDNYKNSDKLLNFKFPLLNLIFSLVLIMLEPDFGSCVVLLMALIMMLFTTRLRIRYFVVCFFLIILALAILILLAPYRMDRLISFVDPFKDPLGSGFQIIQSLFAISPGSFLGKGFNNSIQKAFYLPEPQNDFIFAILVEEFGFIGGSILIILYFYFFFLIYKILNNTYDKFKFYLILGNASLILIQVLINLSVVLNLIPVTGITLPLVSYGGSSICVLMFCIGIMLHE